MSDNKNLVPQDEIKKAKKKTWAYRIIALLGLIAVVLILLFKPCNCDCEKKAQQAYSSVSTTSVAPTAPIQTPIGE